MRGARRRSSTPATTPTSIAEALEGRPVAAIVLTHAHFDHIGAVGELIAATGAPLMIHAEDAERLTSSEAGGTGGAIFGFDHVAPPADRQLEEGDTIVAGELALQVLHTPGHTRGGICLLVTDPRGGTPHLFSGDTCSPVPWAARTFPGETPVRSLARSPRRSHRFRPRRSCTRGTARTPRSAARRASIRSGRERRGYRADS